MKTRTFLARTTCPQTMAGRLRTACAARLLPLLLLALPAVVQAQDYTYTTNNGTITITGYTGSDGAVAIPGTIDGLPVTNIGTNAFSGVTNLTSVTIGNSVTNIGDYAFYNCTSLTSITIGNSVTNIGDRAFYGCSSLTSITIGNSVTSIGERAFYGCASLTSVIIPNSVITIGYGSFSGCTSLASVTIPDSVISIGDLAFAYCTSLTSVVIPNSVITIGGYAFSGCVSLTSVIIPNSVFSIGVGAFSGCTSLTSVTISSSVTYIQGNVFGSCTNLAAITVDAFNPFFSSLDGVLFNKSQTGLIQYPAGKTGSDYTIPNSVTYIGGGAFVNCTSLTSVAIPSSVTSIGSGALSYCTSLTGVYFKGNAPHMDLSLLQGDYNAIVYYLPGTAGWWNPYFIGRPTVLWNPMAEVSDGSFGVRTNRFGFNITGTSGLTIVVDACTDLALPTWVPVGTNTITGGSSYFSDPQWTNYPARFYRLRSP